MTAVNILVIVLLSIIFAGGLYIIDLKYTISSLKNLYNLAKTIEMLQGQFIVELKKFNDELSVKINAELQGNINEQQDEQQATTVRE